LDAAVVEPKGAHYGDAWKISWNLDTREPIMKTRKIIVLGGYGGTGRVLCRKLLEETEVEIVVAGRDMAEAEKLSGQQWVKYRVVADHGDAYE
jgi:shikimate 5-dehydrogenase